tara:strand:+ start:1149 stop:1856 length:708 start_codon:yes stop_codon:yes gene_type:complete
MADNKDKLTIQDYVDYFGEKSAMSDDVLDQLFGTIKSRGDYMESQRGQAMSPEMMQLIMGAVEPGGGIKAVGKAAAKELGKASARGGKNILDILRELLGKGKPEMGDVLAGFKRRSQPSEFVGEKTFGQQVLKLFEDSKQATKLPVQDIPTQGQFFPIRNRNLTTRPGSAEPIQSLPNLTQAPISSRTPEQNVVRNIMRAINRESREVGARNPESYFSRMMTYDDLLEILRKAGR